MATGNAAFEILKAAASAIEECLDELPDTPWHVEKMPEFGVPFHVSGTERDEASNEDVFVGAFEDAAVIRWVLLSPTLLRMVGEYLEDLAGDTLEMPADMRAVAIAEVVLAALKPDHALLG